MFKRIKVKRPRASTSSINIGYRIYIPKLYENKDYVLPSRNATILKGCVKFKSTDWNPKGRLKIQSRLMTEFGFSRPMAEVFSSRRISDIKRIEQVVMGIIDCLLLFDRDMFITDTDFSLLKYLVKKILTVGTFSTSTVTEMWKQYVNHLFVEASESETLLKPKKSPENFFFSLDSYPKIQRIRAGKLSREDLTDLAHLISTRQLPVGDKRVELKALKEFELITTEEYLPDSDILEDLYQAARIIGKRLRKAGPGPIQSTHLSLATSGSLFYTVEEGGRAAEIIESITPRLLHVPVEDGVISLPFIALKERKGVPRWRTWCRDTPYEHFSEIPFGELTTETLLGKSVYRQGFDEAIGDQILCCAYLAMQEDTIRQPEVAVRVLTVAEPGAKARIVTTGPWWLNVLQQCQAHVTRAFLKSHPSAEAGLGRADQAWQYLYLICNARSSFKEDFACLSSDLKSATDAIPKEVAVQLLKGFIHGLGYLSPLMDTAIDLIKRNRLCLVEKYGYTFISTRGVFMGEPLTKTILTLLNLSCEEIAIRHYLNYDWKHPVQESWRCFQVSGDDHIAVGPKDYLNEITRTHIRAGSKISPDKHSVSCSAVRHCEKILMVKYFWNLSWTPRSINDSKEAYESSPFIDSIKVRLLSPCSKNNENFNDRNTAVGKAKSFGRTLQWLMTSHLDTKWKFMVRDRFFQRMGPLLPDRSSGVFWHLLLPSNLGGLGLYIEEDFPDLCIRLPDPTKSFLLDYVSNSLSEETYNLFKGFTNNTSYRGYNLPEGDVALAREFINLRLLPNLGSLSFKEGIAKLSLEDRSAKRQVGALQRAYLFSAGEIEDRILRPFLFKEILSKQAKVHAFSTESFKRRYAKLWDITFKGHPTISSETLKEAISKRVYSPLYDLSFRFEMEIRGRTMNVNLLEEALIGLPDLRVLWTSVGTLTDSVNEASFSL